MIYVGTGGNAAKNDFEAFLESYGIWLAVAFALVIVAVIVAIVLINKNKKPKFNKVENTDSIVVALGGIENIKQVSGIGSRLTVTLKDPSLMNKEELQNNGVTSIVSMSEKFILVIEKEAQPIAERIQKSL